MLLEPKHELKKILFDSFSGINYIDVSEKPFRLIFKLYFKTFTWLSLGIYQIYVWKKSRFLMELHRPIGTKINIKIGIL